VEPSICVISGVGGISGISGISGSTSTNGCGFPTVVTRLSSESSIILWNVTGLFSVVP